MPNFKEAYVAMKEEKAREAAKSRVEDNKRENEDREKLTSYLNSIGATKIWTNGYAYSFEHLNKSWSFVNQTTRICGCCHRLLEDGEKEMVWALRSMDKNSELYALGRSEFNFRDFVIDGEPLTALQEAVEVEVEP